MIYFVFISGGHFKCNHLYQSCLNFILPHYFTGLVPHGRTLFLRMEFDYIWHATPHNDPEVIVNNSNSILYFLVHYG